MNATPQRRDHPTGVPTPPRPDIRSARRTDALALSTPGCLAAAAIVAHRLGGEHELASAVARQCVADGHTEALIACLLDVLERATGDLRAAWHAAAFEAALRYAAELAGEVHQ